LSRKFGWDGSAQPSGPTIYADKAVVVCSEERRQELIRQRERLQALEAKQQGNKADARPVTLPAPETQSNASADPYLSAMESIGKAESWGDFQELR